MDILFREEQVEKIAVKLNISKQNVNLILYNYSTYLQNKLRSGNTIKVLNICYVGNPNEPKDANRETLGFIATELSMLSNMGSTTILRVLLTLEELIIKDIKSGIGYCIRGLIRIRCIRDDNGEYHVRIRKSTNFNGMPVRIITLNSFRRRVDMCNAGEDS